MTAPLVPLLVLLAAGPTDDPQFPIKPTLVRLDFEESSLDEIASALTGRGPNPVAVEPDPFPNGMVVRADAKKKVPPPKTFRVVEPDPLPFWAAMDRIGRATGRQAVIDPRGGEGRVLLRKAIPDRGFASTDGAFRVTLDHLSYSRAITFAPFFYPAPGRAAIEKARLGDTSTFAASLTLMVEPRLKIRSLGALTLLEATDDRGLSLLVPIEERREPQPSTEVGVSSAVGLVAPLRYPADPGTTIRRLRGTIRCVVGDVPAPGPSERDVAVAFDFADIPMP